jgi:hypothetical protein
MNNPHIEGKRHRILGTTGFAVGFTPTQMVDTFYKLTCDRKQEGLLLECASLEEVESEYCPGEDCEDQNSGRLGTAVNMILEAVRVRSFSRTAQTMKALTKALNRFMVDKGLSVGESIIGRPKKSGLFATVTVQLPISDGQIISIVFHSPDNNKMKIAADDEILAFRWLLNKRDITVAVSPEGEADVSLEEVGKRCAMLVEKNSTKFQATQKDIVDQKKALEELKVGVNAATVENQKALDDLKAQQVQSQALDNQIQMTTDQLAKVKDYNDTLQAQLDALAAANAGNKGKAIGEGEKAAKEIEAEQAAAEFEAKKAAFEGELKGRGFDVTGGASISASFGMAAVNGNVSTDMGWKNEYYVGVRYIDPALDSKNAEKKYTSATLAGLDTQIQKALAWIDKKLAGMKDDTAAVEVVNPDTGGTGTNGLEQDKEADPIPEVIEPEVVNKQDDAGTSDNEAEIDAALATLDDILAGKYSDSTTIGDVLDQAAAIFEQYGVIELSEIDQKLNLAADFLTEALKKEAV